MGDYCPLEFYGMLWFYGADYCWRILSLAPTLFHSRAAGIDSKSLLYVTCKVGGNYRLERSVVCPWNCADFKQLALGQMLLKLRPLSLWQMLPLQLGQLQSPLEPGPLLSIGDLDMELCGDNEQMGNIYPGTPRSKIGQSLRAERHS